MTTTLDQSTVKETVERLGKGVESVKAAVSGTIEDGTMAAERLLKRGRNTFEDAVEQSVHGIRRKPVSSVTVAFVAGMAVGFLLSCLRKK